MTECVFCDIVRDRAHSEIVWDDDLVLAFMDINPLTDGHLLIIPKQHSVGLGDIPPETAARMMTVAQQMGKALRSSTLRCQGVNLFFADGEAAFQEVFHSHLHVLPRYEDDGFTIDARRNGSSEVERRSAADAIRSALAT